jgi:FtsH-binding integral membrane protein
MIELVYLLCYFCVFPIVGCLILWNIITNEKEHLASLYPFSWFLYLIAQIPFVFPICMKADSIRSDYTLTVVCIGLSIVVFSPIIVFYQHNKRDY